jgi:hypothetical protein
LRFWPDLRKKVSDYVGLATPQHGTTLVGALCASGCAAALWQMAPDSAFLAALNRGAEVLKGPDWTAIYSRTDDIVAPQTEPAPSSALAPAHGVRSTSIALQTICPADTSTRRHPRQSPRNDRGGAPAGGRASAGELRAPPLIADATGPQARCAGSGRS